MSVKISSKLKTSPIHSAEEVPVYVRVLRVQQDNPIIIRILWGMSMCSYASIGGISDQNLSNDSLDAYIHHDCVYMQRAKLLINPV